VAHSCLQFLGYRTEQIFEDKKDPLFLRLGKFWFPATRQKKFVARRSSLLPLANF
jgi:hypothetical protein